MQFFSGNDLSSVREDLLVKAISRLERVELEDTRLTPNQVQRIFYKIANCENLKLTELVICRNNLSSVPADVLVRAIARLKIIRLRGTDLQGAQILAIFTLVAERRSSSLREVDLGRVDISSSSVPDELRERAKNNSFTAFNWNPIFY